MSTLMPAKILSSHQQLCTATQLYSSGCHHHRQLWPSCLCQKRFFQREEGQGGGTSRAWPHPCSPSTLRQPELGG